jgi:hypothetical protein
MPGMVRITFLMAAIALVWLSSCTSSTETAEPESRSTATTMREGELKIASTEEPVGEGIAEVEAAREAFAEDLGVPIDSVRVIDYEQVTWNDSSLGCSKKGQSYLQVLTPGYRVTLESDGVVRTYHTDLASGGRPPQVVYCAGPGVTSPFEPIDVPPLSSLAAPAIDSARADLQKRLDGDPQISFGDVTFAEVTDLVCDSSEESKRRDGPAKVILEIRLIADDVVHVYRAWTDEVVYCGTDPGLAVE